jgi:hypothetical protein
LTCPRSPWHRPYLIGSAVAIGLVAAIAAEIFWTKPERDSVTTYSQLIAAANAQDVARAQSLCSARYLHTHALRPAREGGMVGLPRIIHKNFVAWRHDANVWLCPSDRVGPIFQFVLEGGRWKFDGPIGILQSRGRIMRLDEEPDPPPDDAAQ